MSGADFYCSAGGVLNAVERWAVGCTMLRETAALDVGRLDALLIPTSWIPQWPAGLYGVEVKIHRSDFLRGLREGQYTRYDSGVNGMYVATLPGVCKTTEVPKECGHLVISRTGDTPIAVCRRKPKFKDAPLTTADIWRVVWDLFDQYRRDRDRELQRLEIAIHSVKQHAGSLIGAIVQKASDKILYPELGDE